MKDPSPKLFIAGAISLALAFFAVVGFAALCGQAWEAEKNATAQDWYDGSAMAAKRANYRKAYISLFAAAPLSIAGIVLFIVGFSKRSRYKAYTAGLHAGQQSAPRS